MVSQPNFSKPEYTSRNVFYINNYGPPNRTWYVNGRLQELGYSKAALDTMTGNADTWIRTAGKGCNVTNEPQQYAIAVWQDHINGAGGLGHVAVVEEVHGGTILISESNWANQLWDTRQLSRNDPSHFIWVPKVPGNLDHHDPAEMHCDADALTVEGGVAEIKDGQGKVIGKVELRYSPSCQTNWCRVTSAIGAVSIAGSVKRQSDDVTCDCKYDNTAQAYTDMVVAPSVKAQACGTINGHSACTPFI